MTDELKRDQVLNERLHYAALRGGGGDQSEGSQTPQNDIEKLSLVFDKWLRVCVATCFACQPAYEGCSQEASHLIVSERE